jgi:hypothetical protein
MMLLERGVSKDLLKGQFEAVRGLEGNNAAGQIERFMKMYNLNYTGGFQVWQMANSGRTDFDNIANEIRETIQPKYESDSVKLQNVLTKISTDGINIGKIKFDEKEMPKLTEIAGHVAEIRRALSPTETDNRFRDNPFIDQTEYNDVSIFNYRNRHRDDYGEELMGEYLDLMNGHGIEAGSDAERINDRFKNEFLRLSSMGVGAIPGVDSEESHLLRDILAVLRRADGRVAYTPPEPDRHTHIQIIMPD